MGRATQILGLVATLGLGLPCVARAETTHAPSAQKAPRKRPPRVKPPRGGVVAAPPAVREAPAEPARELRAPSLAIERFTLDNGLRVVLAPVRHAPSVAVSVLYDAGARQEDRGSAGLASLMRHAMNLGSANLLRGERERHLAARGGRSWSDVSSERALYVNVLPVNELPLGLWLEADRLKSLQLTADGVSAQREVLLGELAQRSAADPRDPGRARVRALVFQSLWPYEHDPRGGASEVSALKPEAAQPFYEAYYNASNAVLVVAGDIETESTSQLVRRFFETARRQERPAPAFSAALPEQTSQRTASIDAPALAAPSLLYGWPAPAGRTDDAVATEAALFVLARGRLPQRLQQERGLATRVSFALEEQRAAGLARVEVDLADGAARGEAEKLIEAELDALAQKGPSEAEIARFRAHVEADAWRVAQDPEALARDLGDYELLHGDARMLSGELPRVAALTREKVRAAAARYLSTSRRSFVLLAPSGADAAPPPAPAPVMAPAMPPGAAHRPHKPPRPAKPKHR